MPPTVCTRLRGIDSDCAVDCVSSSSDMPSSRNLVIGAEMESNKPSASSPASRRQNFLEELQACVSETSYARNKCSMEICTQRSEDNGSPSWDLNCLDDPQADLHPELASSRPNSRPDTPVEESTEARTDLLIDSSTGSGQSGQLPAERSYFYEKILRGNPLWCSAARKRKFSDTFFTDFPLLDYPPFDEDYGSFPASCQKRLKVDHSPHPLTDHSDYCRGSGRGDSTLPFHSPNSPQSSDPEDSRLSSTYVEFLEEELSGLSYAPFYSVFEISDQKSDQKTTACECTCRPVAIAGSSSAGQKTTACECTCRPVAIAGSSSAHPFLQPTSSSGGVNVGASCSGMDTSAAPRHTVPFAVPNTSLGCTGSKKKYAVASFTAKVSSAAKISYAAKGSCASKVTAKVSGAAKVSGTAKATSKASSVNSSRPSPSSKGKRGLKAKPAECAEDMERKLERNRQKALKEKERRDKSKKRLEEVKSTIRRLCPSALGQKASQQKVINTLLTVLKCTHRILLSDERVLQK